MNKNTTKKRPYSFYILSIFFFVLSCIPNFIHYPLFEINTLQEKIIAHLNHTESIHFIASLVLLTIDVLLIIHHNEVPNS